MDMEKAVSKYCPKVLAEIRWLFSTEIANVKLFAKVNLSKKLFLCTRRLKFGYHFRENIGKCPKVCFFLNASTN